MSARSQDPHLAQLHSDELAPPAADEDPITCLDEIGLDKELDAAVAEVRRALGEGGARADAEIRRAVAAWILEGARRQLSNARLMTTGGPDHFFSILNSRTPPAGRDDRQGGEDQVF